MAGHFPSLVMSHGCSCALVRSSHCVTSQAPPKLYRQNVRMQDCDGGNVRTDSIAQYLSCNESCNAKRGVARVCVRNLFFHVIPGCSSLPAFLSKSALSTAKINLKKGISSTRQTSNTGRKEERKEGWIVMELGLLFKYMPTVRGCQCDGER